MVGSGYYLVSAVHPLATGELVVGVGTSSPSFPVSDDAFQKTVNPNITEHAVLGRLGEDWGSIE